MDILTLAVALGYTKKQIEEVKREGFKVQVEQDRSILETTGEEKILYLLPKVSSNLSNDDGYDEFVYANNKWEWVGKTDVDLSQYALKEDVGDLDDLPTTDKSSLVAAVSETFTSVSNGKAIVASAITDKGVQTSSDATFSEMAQNIENIPSGGGTLIPKTITQNGVYNASSDNADGYDVVTVSVPEKNTLDEYFAGTLEVANIPSATSIPQSFFQRKTNLTSVIMPNVRSIGYYAFAGCTNLSLTSLPSGISSIGDFTFDGCKKISITSLPNGVNTIRNCAFRDCTGIPFLDFSNFDHVITLLVTTAFNDTNFPFYFRDQQQLDEWAAATNWSTYANRFQIKPSGVM